jgi:hypothetical protein
MGKTICVARDRAFDQTKTVFPAEVARGVYMQNVPSLQALKVMHLMIAVAGGQMAEDVQHQFRLSDIRKIEGMRHHDRASLTPLIRELRHAELTYDDTEKKRLFIGGMLDEAEVDYRDEISGDLQVLWWFGRTFRRVAAESNHWTILDRQTVFHLGSRYSVLLFQHIASLMNLDRINAKTFTVPELRALFGVAEGKLERFSHFNSRAIQPSVSEINRLSRLNLVVTSHKVGRTVSSVTIGWQLKPDPTEKKSQISKLKINRKARRDGTEKIILSTFPETGSINYSHRWIELKHSAGCNVDNAKIAADFRRFMSGRGIALNASNIEKLFFDFCCKVGRA